MNANSCGHELYSMSSSSVGSVKAAVARILDQDQWIWCDANREEDDAQDICSTGTDENAFESEVNTPITETLFSADGESSDNFKLYDACTPTQSPLESCEPSKYAVRRAVRHFAGLFDALTGPQQIANTTRAKVLISALMHAIVNASSKEEQLSPTHRHNMSHKRLGQSVDRWTQSLANAFHALCLSPSSSVLQRNFLRQHIMMTLALLKCGIAPGALTKGWVRSSSQRSKQLAKSSDSLPALSFLAARSAMIFALRLRRAISQS